MKKISIKNNEYVLIDNEEYGHLKKFHWFKDSNGYVIRRGQTRNGRTWYIHRWIMGEPTGLVVDHIDGNKLNNCKYNLRICYQYQNSCNSRKIKIGASKYKGAYFDKRAKINPWSSQIMVNRKNIWLGSFVTEKEAAIAYNKAARKYHGEFALLNEVV